MQATDMHYHYTRVAYMYYQYLRVAYMYYQYTQVAHMYNIALLLTALQRSRSGSIDELVKSIALGPRP